MIEDLMQVLSLKEEDVRTYLALLDSGAASASDLAKYMGSPRPSVYGYLERLTAAGLVYQSQKQGIKLFVPESPDRLSLLFQRRIQEMQSQQKKLDDLMPELERRAGLNLLRPRMQFFEGRSGLEAALEDLLAYPDITTMAFWPIKAAIDATSSDFFRYLNVERVKRNIFIKGIWPSHYAEDAVNYHFMGSGTLYKREVRIAPPGVDFSMGYWIYANKVFFMSSRAESYGFTVESKDLSQMMEVQHRFVWESSTPLATNPMYDTMFIRDLAE